MTASAWLRRVGLVIVTLALLEYVALPQLVEARSELHLFVDASPWLLAAALVLEVCSLLAYTSLTQTVLDPSEQLPFSEQLRIDLTGLGASHLLPGGGASAAALRFRLMTTRGVPSSQALSTAAVQTAIAVAGLLATFTGGVALALPGIWSHPRYLVAGVAGMVILAALLLAVRRAEDSSWDPVRAQRRDDSRTRRDPGWVTRLVVRVSTSGRAVAGQALALLRQRARRRALLGWAASNWLFDAASLWICLWAYGITIHPGALLAAYGAANLAGMLPVTPGGLGIVEGVLIPSLTVLGSAGGPVVLGVLTWRLLEFWLPIPVAGLCYLSLRLSPPPGTRARHQQI